MTSARWMPLPVAAKKLKLPFRRVLTLVRSHQLEGQLVAGCRWFVSTDELARFRRAHGRAA